jgi:4-hydroxybenzoate polyprenyltransferase
MARKPAPRRQARPQQPARPRRESALFHLVLGALLLLVAWLTGGDLVRAVVVAVGYVVIAIAYSWWRFRKRLRREAETAASPAQNGRVR